MSARPELKVTQSTNTSSNLRQLTSNQVDDEVGFISFFRNLPIKDVETIRIFKRGTSGADFYTAHGDDAAFIAMTVSELLSITQSTLLIQMTGLQDYLRSPPTGQDRHRFAVCHDDHNCLP